MTEIETTSRRRAHAVRIHGLLREEEGEISAAEIAHRLKIRPEMVRSIIAERGWRAQSFAATKTRQAAEKTLSRDANPGVRPVYMEFV